MDRYQGFKNGFKNFSRSSASKAISATSQRSCRALSLPEGRGEKELQFRLSLALGEVRHRIALDEHDSRTEGTRQRQWHGLLGNDVDVDALAEANPGPDKRHRTRELGQIFAPTL